MGRRKIIKEKPEKKEKKQPVEKPDITEIKEDVKAQAETNKINITIKGPELCDDEFVEKLCNNISEALSDRMLRHQANPPCPRCEAHPTICMTRRKDYSSHRCRQCGHRWEL